jgi:DNA-directed RNA polymerase subunit beta'
MKKQNQQQNIDKIIMRLASPEKILEWSKGEVTRPETVNYRTQRSEKNGLFDERIFGPEKDYECYCGKYKGPRYKGIVCEKCGVEITRSVVRRDRMGHITLASPVAHIWFLRSMPSRISLAMGMSSSDVEKVVYFAGYLITSVEEDERKRILKDLESEFKNKVKAAQDTKTKDKLKELYLETKSEVDGIQEGRVINEVEYHKFSMKFGSLFEAKIGAEAVYEILKNLDLAKIIEMLEKDLQEAPAVAREKLNKRLSLFRSMHKAGIRPEWMFLQHIPITPPGLRPMVALDGGRQATSDINDLYRRVINRNNRLKKLMDIGAPDVILRNEKRILQEAVDALIDNSIRHNSGNNPANQANKRPLKSLADNLKGKNGLFRRNLLGKRVDYSGRSVIVIGPTLKLNECGLPKHMALELFRPFVISELLKRELAHNIRGAGRLIDEGVPEVWEIIEKVIKDKYVLLNRAPTLHRLGIQAFKPILIEGMAIQVHPLVCTAFNADFDGDQMAVHVPLSVASQYEAREIMAADKNILKPGSGDPVVSAKLLDILLGCYWMTKIIPAKDPENTMRFGGPNMAITAHDFGLIKLRDEVKIRGKEGTKFYSEDGHSMHTTVGRILFNSVLPDDYPYVNEEINKTKMSSIVSDLLKIYGIEKLPGILDQIKEFGFKYATVSGTTWGMDDIKIPEQKPVIVSEATEKVKVIAKQHADGLLSDIEKKRKVTAVWHEAKNKLEELIPETLDPNGSVYDMWKSGARGSLGQLTNMAGMKGLIVNSKGEEVEFPVLSCSKEGFTPIEYFTSTHGSRKGLADTALNTAKAGYLTRRLFVAAQDVIVSEEDCGTKKHIVISKNSDSGIEVSMAKKIRGRVLAADIKGADGKTLFKKDHLVSKLNADEIEKADVSDVSVYSPLTCECRRGVCAKCYGVDLGNDHMVDIGEAVGTVAAQAIGEPGTQLTMRTFHAGGTASVGGDITQGLPRVEEIFERRKPKAPATISKIKGIVSEIRDEGKDKIVTVLADAGTTKAKSKETEYTIPPIRSILVSKGEAIEKGQLITDGSADLSELYKYAGQEKTQEYIISQINKIYELQGESVSRKHIEIIVRQMFSKVKIVTGGDTKFTTGEIVGVIEFQEENEKAKNDKGTEAEADVIILGITETSLTRKSFLSAASFQHTTKVLINSAVKGIEDELHGLMENVIIGRLIPAGTGFKGSRKNIAAEEIEADAKTQIEAMERSEYEK